MNNKKADSPLSPPDLPFLLLGLAGKMRAGKDYIGNLLVKEYGFQLLKIAHPLYLLWEICGNDKENNQRCEYFLPFLAESSNLEMNEGGVRRINNDIIELFQNALQTYHDSNQAKRFFLQKAGDILRAGMGEFSLLNHCLKTISILGSKTPELPTFVLTDIRLYSEAKTVQEWGGYLFVVETPEAVIQQRLGGAPVEALVRHYTEQDLLQVKRLPGVQTVSGESNGIPEAIKTIVLKFI